MKKILAGLVLLWPVSAARAQVLTISAPNPAVVVGGTMTLTPLLRDGNGNLLAASDWVWTATNPDILSVDQHGVVKGLKLGIGGVMLTAPAESFSLFGLLQIQVQPQSVAVTPPSITLDVGNSFRFTATAYDASNQPIPGAVFTWFLTNEGGVPQIIPPTTNIDASGNFTSTDAGHYTVHALISYTPILQGLPSHFEALSEVTVIVPPAFRLNRLIANDPVSAKSLLPAPGVFVGSDSGELQFTASAGGLSTVVIDYQAGTPQAVVATGSPSPEPGGVVAGFQSIAMNDNGASLISIAAGDTANGALLARSPQGTQYVLLDNANGSDQTGLPASQLTFLSLTPYCLNDNGDAVMRALYLPQDAVVAVDGLFLLRNALAPHLIPLLLWSANQGVPSVPVSGTPALLQFIFDDTENVPGWAGQKGLGIDNNDNVYFMAQSGTARALEQVSVGNSPQKILAVGDTWPGSTTKVKDIQDLIVERSGDLAMMVSTIDGFQHVARYHAGTFTDLQIPGAPIARVLAASAAGVVFQGVAVKGMPQALNLWNFKTVTDILDLSSSVTYISTATISSTGKVVAVVESPTNNFVLTQPGTGTLFGSSAPVTLFSSGAAVTLNASLDLKSLVNGSRTALPSVQMSSPASLFDLDGAGNAVARITPGQSLGSGALFSGTNNIVEDSSGNQYFVSSGGLYRASGGTVTLLLGVNAKASDGVLLTPLMAMGSNSQGAVLVDCMTNAIDLHRRLYKIQGTTMTLVTRTKTSFGPHQIVNWNAAALDDNGNPAVIVVEEDGALELIEWVGPNATSISNTRAGTQVAGEQVATIDHLKGGGAAFFARFALTADYTHAAAIRFTATSLQVLIESGASLPDGTLLGDIRVIDGNRNGDSVVAGTEVRTGSQVIEFRAASGNVLVVADNNQPLSTGDYMERFTDLNLRDDGTIYFIGLDVNDRELVFRSQPGAPTGPTVNPGGILNAADFRGDTLTAGAWFTIYGQNFGVAAQWAGDPNTFSLGGASVTVCGMPATLSFNSGPLSVAGATLWQINALMPDAVAGQTSCPVVVTVNSQPAPTVTVPIAPGELLLFGFTASSSGPLPIVTHLDYSLVGAVADGLKPAKTGEILLGWGSGNCTNPQITVGSKPAAVQFSGRVGAGLCQINFAVPAGVTGGNTLAISTSPHQYTLWVQ